MKISLLLVCILALAALTPPRLDSLKLNQIQCIGSHNSYKQAIEPALFALLTKSDSVRFKAIEYSHTSLTNQLNLGLQNLEIDIYADAKGGKYAHPMGLQLAKNQQTYDATGVMNEPGFKVFHIQDIDFRSNAPTFKGCLAELKGWSDAHPDHYPVFITMNAKDDTIRKEGFTLPEPFTASVLNQLDSVILAGLGRSKLIMPDDVRGNKPTLEAAVLAGNWPTLQASKGKFLFVLDETGAKRSAYIAGHPSLKNRVLFTNSEPSTPEAAFLILNNSIEQQGQIKAMVKKGYLVRTRADSDTWQARTNDKRNFEAACQSGAQIITTDYYAKSQFFPSDYIISFANGTYLRQNPLTH
ncbi:phosphatidylinositol-specific phospholipase C1-like protein [Spirosoma fluviale]|uniref:Phosphoinositide phospholipase C, Ca2+-dependent n=1 Tax=Spirosoma fluviale TaxID=1597977 RepID=A0A286GS36_9BACT|nr:phosphatidylinositol-specific phospholipase C1-like protein [Spirosoma fluviale]SOD98381.1 Phosphoinositide phospholipase C, Ca2+-dependent [Spirosoma fluviale]